MYKVVRKRSKYILTYENSQFITKEFDSIDSIALKTNFPSAQSVADYLTVRGLSAFWDIKPQKILKH